MFSVTFLSGLMQAFVSFLNTRDKYNAYCIGTDNSEKIFHAYFTKENVTYIWKMMDNSPSISSAWKKW